MRVGSGIRIGQDRENVGVCLGDIGVDFLGLWGELVLGRISLTLIYAERR